VLGYGGLETGYWRKVGSSFQISSINIHMRGIDEDDGAGLGSGMAGARVSHFIFFLFWLSEFGNVSFLTTSFHMIDFLI
jgi:hypothetical protein